MICIQCKFSAKVERSEVESEGVEVEVLDESVMYLTTWETPVRIFADTLSYKQKWFFETVPAVFSNPWLCGLVA